MSAVQKALALYDNESEDPDELSFKINDLLFVVHENWQDGWHLCKIGEKQGLAPANYLQILVKPNKSLDDGPNDIYDCPRNWKQGPPSGDNNEETDVYVFSDYQNINGNREEPEDIYMNTSAAALTIDSSHSSQTTPPRRPPPVAQRINYPATPLQQQTSEYMDMNGAEDLMGDYSEILETECGNDYDEVPNNPESYDSGAIIKSSNESVKSSGMIYPSHSNDSLSLLRKSDESLRSYDSGMSSSRQEMRRESPPSIPSKTRTPHLTKLRSAPRPTGAYNEHSDYMVPPMAAAATFFSHSQPESEVNDESAKQARSSTPEPARSTTATPEKKKKKSNAGLDTLPKFFGNLTLKKNKQSQQGTLTKSHPLSRSLENISKHCVQLVTTRPLPDLPSNSPKPERSKTISSPDSQKIEYRARPLPPTPDREQEDYSEIEDKPVSTSSPKSRPQPPSFERQRSRSCTTAPFSQERQIQRTPSNNGISYEGNRNVSYISPEELDDDLHDYTEVPEMGRVPSSYYEAALVTPATNPNRHATVGMRPSIPSTEPPRLPSSMPPKLPRNTPPELKTKPGKSPNPIQVPSQASPYSFNRGQQNDSRISPRFNTMPSLSPSLSGDRRASPPVVYSPETLSKLPPTHYTPASASPGSGNFPFSPISPRPAVVEIDVSKLSNPDKSLIQEHCGLISGTLLRSTTHTLITLKQVTDSKDVENYVPACTATGSACIEIIKHLTALAERCQNGNLNNLTTAHKQKLREIVKRLVETVKMAKVQYPSALAYNEMLASRNELISAIREVKTFVVKLLHPPS